MSPRPVRNPVLVFLSLLLIGSCCAKVSKAQGQPEIFPNQPTTTIPRQFPTEHPKAPLQEQLQFPPRQNPIPRENPFAEPVPEIEELESVLPRKSRPLKRSAEKDDADGQTPAKKSRSSWWQTVISLVIVILLILILARVWKGMGFAGRQNTTGHALEVLTRRPLDQRQNLSLVRCGYRILVLGSTPNGVQTLTEITDPTEVEYLTSLCRPPETSNVIASKFRNLIGKKLQETAAETPTPPAAEPVIPLSQPPTEYTYRPLPPEEKRAS